MEWYWIALIVGGIVAPWIISGKAIRIAFEERGIAGGLGTWLGVATGTTPIVFLGMWLMVSLFPPSETGSHFSAAIEYHNKGVLIFNRVGSENAVVKVAQADLEPVIGYYRKAIAEAKLADIDHMNKHYPEFGDHFRDDFIRGHELFIETYEADGASTFAAQVLMDRWGDWYEANVRGITGN